MKFGAFYNGIGKSKYDQQRFDDILSCNIHETPGEVKSNLAMAKESGTTIDEPVIMAVVPTGDVYLASKTSGKIWKRTTAGEYSLVNTNANGAHLGIRYFNGFLYYATATKLGQFNLSSTWNDSFGTFTIGNTSYKPMTEVNQELFIGDGYYVAAVDETGSFSANVLDLQSQHQITALAQWGTSLLVGTRAGTYYNKSGVFRWDTFSPSWNQEDTIDEVGINCFIPADNHLYAQAGTVGNLYYYDGTQLIKNKVLRNVTTSVGQEHLATNYNGLPLYGTNGVIYSIGSHDNDLPIAINKEYATSVGEGKTIHSILAVGSQLLAAWQDGSTYGVDALTTNMADGYIITPEVGGSPQNVFVRYNSLPANTTIDLYLSIDGGSFTQITSEWFKDNKRSQYELQGGFPSESYEYVQVKIVLNSYTTSTPSIKEIEIV